MKNQYFADINDYRKYGLLRLLSNNGKFPTSICWMLTNDDGRNDGNNEGYIDQAHNWRRYDPELFDILKEVINSKRIDKKRKDVKVAEEKQIIQSALYYDPEISNNRIFLNNKRCERKEYFDKFFEFARQSKLIFFDPDNGLEVNSVPLGFTGRQNSSKYLYWDELKQTIQLGHSVLVYQHFTRSPHELFVDTKAKNIYKQTGINTIYSFRTAHVVFFLILQNEHRSFDILKGIRSVDSKWENKIRTKTHIFNERLQICISWSDGTAVTTAEEAIRAFYETGFDIKPTDIKEVEPGMGLWSLKLPPKLKDEFENLGKIERISNNFHWENDETYVDDFCDLPTLPIHLMRLIKD